MSKATPTRDRLIHSALFLFWERGFAGTSMSDLLAHAQVNSGSFYHFFESKEALLKAVLDEYLAGLGPQIVAPAYEQTNDPIERIFAILAGYRGRILFTNCQYGKPSRSPTDRREFSRLDRRGPRLPRTSPAPPAIRHRPGRPGDLRISRHGRRRHDLQILRSHRALRPGRLPTTRPLQPAHLPPMTPRRSFPAAATPHKPHPEPPA